MLHSMTPLVPNLSVEAVLDEVAVLTRLVTPLMLCTYAMQNKGAFWAGRGGCNATHGLHSGKHNNADAAAAGKQLHAPDMFCHKY